MTTIPDAFMGVTTLERTKVQATVPREWAQLVFNRMLPLRGAQARLLGCLLKWFVGEMQNRGGSATQDLIENERIATDILSELGRGEILLR